MSGVITRTTRILSSTVAVTNTFQTIEAANISRCGGTIQNNGSNTMYVYPGPVASATKAASIVLSPGQSVSLIAPGVVMGDEINITGTAGDAFYAGFQ